MNKKLLFIILFLLLWLLLIVFFAGRVKASEQDYYLFASTAPYPFQRYQTLTLSQNVFLVATTGFWEGSTASWIKSVIVSRARERNINPELVLEIVRKESNFIVDTCNKTTIFGCAAGQGLFQIIYSTEKTCEKYFQREMNMLDINDNLDCGFWLLTKDGIKKGIEHWNKWSGPYNYLL